MWSSFFLDDSAPGAQKKSEMSRRLPNNVRRLGGLFCVEKNESQKPRSAMTEKGALENFWTDDGDYRRFRRGPFCRSFFSFSFN